MKIFGQFSHNVRKRMLVNTVLASSNTTVGQMKKKTAQTNMKLAKKLSNKCYIQFPCHLQKLLGTHLQFLSIQELLCSLTTVYSTKV